MHQDSSTRKFYIQDVLVTNLGGDALEADYYAVFHLGQELRRTSSARKAGSEVQWADVLQFDGVPSHHNLLSVDVFRINRQTQVSELVGDAAVPLSNRVLEDGKELVAALPIYDKRVGPNSTGQVQFSASSAPSTAPYSSTSSQGVAALDGLFSGSSSAGTNNPVVTGAQVSHGAAGPTSGAAAQGVFADLDPLQPSSSQHATDAGPQQQKPPASGSPASAADSVPNTADTGTHVAYPTVTPGDLSQPTSVPTGDQVVWLDQEQAVPGQPPISAPAPTTSAGFTPSAPGPHSQPVSASTSAAPTSAPQRHHGERFGRLVDDMWRQTKQGTVEVLTSLQNGLQDGKVKLERASGSPAMDAGPATSPPSAAGAASGQPAAPSAGAAAAPPPASDMQHLKHKAVAGTYSLLEKMQQGLEWGKQAVEPNTPPRGASVPADGSTVPSQGPQGPHSQVGGDGVEQVTPANPSVYAPSSYSYYPH